MSQNNQDYSLFEITKKGNGYDFKEVALDAIHKGDKYYRKSRKRVNPPQNQQPFKDSTFPLQFKDNDRDYNGTKFQVRRLWDVYQKEYDLLSPEFFTEKPMAYEPKYPSFMLEFSMIDREYVKTIFLTQKINKRGVYEYFVRRNGEYYTDYVDDQIPVHGQKQVSAWGLTYDEPWQIILMKAWIKEKKGIEGVLNAQPFDFVQAFGMPGYRAISLKKEIDFLKVSHLREETKEKKEARIPINIKGFISVGKTRNNTKVTELGLQQNRAGYRITPIEAAGKSLIKESGIDEKQGNIYKITSPVYTKWIGSLSVVQQGRINSLYDPKVHKMNLERQFLATYDEISSVFSRFYITPEYTSKYQSGTSLLQDSYVIPFSPEPHVYKLDVKTEGFMNINIDLPKASRIVSGSKIRYPTIKFFMSQLNTNKEEEGIELLKYKYYDIEYVKAYHHSCNRFLNIKPGTYFIYVKIEALNGEKINTYTINFNTNANINSFEKVQLPVTAFGQLINSTFWDYSKTYGLKSFIHKDKKDLLVLLGNTYDEIGFAFLSLKVDKTSMGELAMRIHSKKFKENGMEPCKEGNYTMDKDGNILVIAKPGLQKTVVFERLHRRNTVNEKFPPSGCVEFIEIA